MVRVITVGIVVTTVPSLSVTLDDGQYQYIIATKDEGQPKSERLRELLDKGMEAEDDE